MFSLKSLIHQNQRIGIATTKNSGECSASGCNNKDSSICNEVDKEERKLLAMESNLLISNCWNATSVFGLILFIFGMGILGCLAMIGYPSFLKCE